MKMWTTIILVILPILANVGSYIVVPEDEILMRYKNARAKLNPEQEEFLMELLAADDALIESASRGIVDDILQAIAGLGQGQLQVNLVGPGNLPQQQQQQQQPQAPAPIVQQSQPAPSPSSGQFTLDIAALDLTPTQQATLTAMLEKSLENTTSQVEASTAAPVMTPQDTVVPSMMPQATATGAPPAVSPNPTPKQSTTNSNVTTIGGNNNHLFNTITSVIMNSNRRNVTGIVDQSLRIATPAPIREFVTGILNVVYCNGIRRLLGRC